MKNDHQWKFGSEIAPLQNATQSEVFLGDQLMKTIARDRNPNHALRDMGSSLQPFAAVAQWGLTSLVHVPRIASSFLFRVI